MSAVRVVAIACFVLAGCAAFRAVRFGVDQTTTLPAGLKWCRGTPGVITGPVKAGEETSSEALLPARLFKHCTRILRDDGQIDFDGANAAQYQFLLTRGDDGRMGEVCLLAGNFGSLDTYLGCVTDVVRRERPAMTTSEALYKYTFVFD